MGGFFAPKASCAPYLNQGLDLDLELDKRNYWRLRDSCDRTTRSQIYASLLDRLIFGLVG